MKAALIGDGCHYCTACGRYYPGGRGEVRTEVRLNGDHEDGTLLDDVSTITLYFCRDPRGECELTADEISFYDQTWECGECENIYGTVREAIECCT